MATGTDLHNSEILYHREEHACPSENEERKQRSENSTSNSVSRDENQTNDENRTADSAAVDNDKIMTLEQWTEEEPLNQKQVERIQNKNNRERKRKNTPSLSSTYRMWIRPVMY